MNTATHAVVESTPLLSPDQIRQYHQDGYLIVPNLLSDQEVATFLADEKKPKSKEWVPGLMGHKTEPHYRDVAKHPVVVGMTEQILQGPAYIVQTMLLHKAGGGQGIALHQDTHYLPCDPNTLMACWIALTDTDAQNGGLCIVPGSHTGGLRKARKNQNPEQITWEHSHDMRDRDGREYKQMLHAFEIEDLDMNAVLRLTVPRGAGVFFTGMTIHGSYANKTSDRVRTSFATHYVKEGTWLYRLDVQDTVPAR